MIYSDVICCWMGRHSTSRVVSVMQSSNEVQRGSKPLGPRWGDMSMDLAYRLQAAYISRGSGTGFGHLLHRSGGSSGGAPSPPVRLQYKCVFLHGHSFERTPANPQRFIIHHNHAVLFGFPSRVSLSPFTKCLPSDGFPCREHQILLIQQSALARRSQGFAFSHSSTIPRK